MLYRVAVYVCYDLRLPSLLIEAICLAWIAPRQQFLGIEIQMKTLLATVFFATCCVFLTACGVDNSFEAHMVRANQFAEESKYKSAVIELKSALSEDGKSAEARWLLGKVYLESGDVLSAEKELQRARDLGWADNDVVPALAESMLAQGKFAEIRQLSERELEPASQVRLLAAKAHSAISQGETQQASRYVSKALNKDPISTHALFAKARISYTQGDLDAADEDLKELMAVAPENADVWSLLGDVRAGQRRLEDALAAYSQAIEFQTNNYAVMFKRGLLSLRLENFESAQLDVDELLKVVPQHPGANYIQGLLHFNAARYPEAITALSVAEPVYSQFPLVLFFLGSAQLIEGKLDQAVVQAARFHNLQPQSIPGRKLLATIRLQQGKNDDVQELLATVLASNPEDIGALNLMASALLRDDKAEEGITLLTKVAELQPDSPIAQVRLGAGLLVTGKGGDAERHIEAALDLNPEFQEADILLVLNHLQNQAYEAAIAAAKAYRLRNPTSVTPLNLLGRVYQQAGQNAKAKESFEDVLKRDASDPGANHNLAQIAISEGDFKSARGYYQGILKDRQDFLLALIQLALLEARQGNGEEVVILLERARVAHPESLDPRLLLGRYYLSANRPEKVATLFSELEEGQKNSPQVLELTALAQLASKDHGDAQYTLEQLMKTLPESAAMHHLMAQALSGSGRDKRAIAELNSALALDENYLPSRLALARIALRKQHMPEFDQHLDKLVESAPENPEVLLLRAAAARRDGEGAKAVKFAEQAFALAPATATLLALGLHMESSASNEEALELYSEWLDQHPEDVAVRLAIAGRFGVANREGEAKDQYEEVIRIDEDNVVALNNLAWYLRDEDSETALEYARRASTLQKDSSAVLDTLAVVEFKNKQYEQAKRSVLRALKLTPTHPSMLYHKAMILVALEDGATALKILEELYESGAEFPEQEDAKQLRISLAQ